VVLIYLPVENGYGQAGAQYYFQKGNQAYRQEHYQEALQWYQKVLDLGLESAALYYNMGNCYYKLNKIGYAILYLEKAKKLAPRDADIAFNLDIVRLKTIDRVEALPEFFLMAWWNKLRHFWNLRQWTHIFLACWLSFFTFLVVYRLVSRPAVVRIFRLGLWVLGGILVLTTIFLWSNIQEARHNHPAVVLASSVSAYSAPDSSSVEVFVIHEGLTVKVDDQHGEWVKIVLADGKQGWIRRKTLGFI